MSENEVLENEGTETEGAETENEPGTGTEGSETGNEGEGSESGNENPETGSQESESESTTPQMTDYDPTTWSGGDVISAVNLNKIEEAIDNLYNLMAHIEVVVMQGATTTTDGLSGYVPKPTVVNADYQKFLRGDATWTNDGTTLTLDIGNVTTGTLDPTYLGDVPGANIIDGSITSDKISSAGLPASIITSGELDASYIGNIPAEKIVVEDDTTISVDALPVFGLNTSGIVTPPASLTGGFLKDNATWGPACSTQTVTLTSNGFDINTYTQTVSVTGVTTDSLIMVSPQPSSLVEYNTCAIYCQSQGVNSLTFVASKLPNNSLTVNVMIF